VGHQTSDASIAIEKWVNPKKRMMFGCGSEDRIGLAEPSISFLETGQKSRTFIW